jgi:Uncharacterized conserved protein
MIHYLAVLVPLSQGGWRAHFPDFPGCRAEGHTVEAALKASGSAVSKQAEWYCQQHVSLPTPQSYDDLRHHSMNSWAAEREIDWARAVVSLVPIRIPD